MRADLRFPQAQVLEGNMTDHGATHIESVVAPSDVKRKVVRSSILGGHMRSFIGPAAHHGSTPIRDPRVPGVTAGGDSTETGGSRPHREIVIIAMALVVAVSALSFWFIFRPTGDESAARDAAGKLGLTFADSMRVKTIDGGFRIVRSVGTGPAHGYGYSFDIVETPSVTAPAEASTWNGTVDGATSYAEGDPPTRLLIDAGAHSWIVTSITPRIYADDGIARAAWYDLAASIMCGPAT